MKKYFILIAAVVAVFAMTSCRKEVTKVVHDNNGNSGAQTAVYSIMPEDWAVQNDSTYYYASFDVPELTDAIYDHGAVIVYLSFKDKVYEALPEVYDAVTYGTVHSVGSVTVDMADIDGYKFQPPANEVYAKIVLISAKKLQMHPGVNLQNFGEVKKAFHLN